ncbi:MAG: hypothetical protein Q9166_005015 [cf. Caloplaca sp. 2 TL-2023]
MKRMKTAQIIATSAPLHPDTYIYKILPINEKVVSISSDDNLRVIDPTALGLNGTTQNIHDGVTCLEGFQDRGVLTAGRDGLVKCSDLRTKDFILELSESSTDGLVNLYNTAITDEDDAVTQVFNHGSSVAHAGFLSDHEVFALSHDEIFSIYDATDSDQGDASNHVSNWALDMSDAIRLPDAHGEEVVRSICPSEDVSFSTSKMKPPFLLTYFTRDPQFSRGAKTV